jgi:glutaredoxin-related protein
MSRKILSEESISPEALSFIHQNHTDVVKEVINAVNNNKIVVVGMGQNPVVKKAKKVLSEKNLEFHSLSYGNYFSQWQARLAIKMWSGWPTYPQVFIEGKLIGGCDELIKFLEKKKL